MCIPDVSLEVEAYSPCYPSGKTCSSAKSSSSSSEIATCRWEGFVGMYFFLYVFLRFYFDGGGRKVET